MADLTTQLSKFLTDLYAGTLGILTTFTSVTVSAGTGGAKIQSPTDGIAQISNAAGTGVTRLVLGANDATTSGVGLAKTGGGTLAVVTGDGSANASLTAGSYQLGGNLLASSTAPTVASGFGTSPVIVANGTAGFTINVGTGGVATGGVITMPTATTGWIANVKNLTQLAANRADRATVQTASSTTSITVQSVILSTGAATAWTASDILQISAVPY